MSLIQPAKKGAVLREEMLSWQGGENGFALWWLGQSGFLLRWKDEFLLFDPYLSDSLTHKYATTDKPHTRMSELAINPASLDFVTTATSSHNHTDHLDQETLAAIAGANGSLNLVLPSANIQFAQDRMGTTAPLSYHGLNAGENLRIGPWKFHGISAAHNEIDRDEFGRCLYLGMVVEFGGHCIYHSGDTLWHPNLVQELSSFSISVAILPINGNKPERRVAGNLDGKEAANLAKEISADVVIPCHYHLFTFNTEEPDDFETECSRIGQVCEVLPIGGRFEWSS